MTVVTELRSKLAESERRQRELAVEAEQTTLERDAAREEFSAAVRKGWSKSLIDKSNSSQRRSDELERDRAAARAELREPVMTDGIRIRLF